MSTDVQCWPGVVVISGPALKAAADAVLIAIRSRRLSGLPHSKTHADLAAAFIQAAGAGQEDVPDVVVAETSPTVPIDEASKQLGLSKRQTRRLAEKLGGRVIGGRWLLDQAAITEHMEGRATHGTN